EMCIRDSEGAGSGRVRIDALLGPLIESWRNRPGQTIEYRLTVEPGSCEIPQGLALALYRMTQEALTNVARHAGARAAAVTVKARAGVGVEWSVCDDGIGIASDCRSDALQQGNGLAGIRERAWAHGGELEMGARDPAGVRPGLCLVARFPWPDAECAVGTTGNATTA
ncbi:hypothetical protein GPA22_19075, partial [Aromatoleum toluvorans]|nr:hypothetical protein [Aromatoleum toluvorans]